MRKLKVYLDTSVISHLQQEDVPEKMHETQELWRQLKERPDVDIIISDLVIREISKCSEPKLSFLLGELAQIDYKIVQVTEEERGLADIYPNLPKLLYIGFKFIPQIPYKIGV